MKVALKLPRVGRSRSKECCQHIAPLALEAALPAPSAVVKFCLKVAFLRFESV